MVDAVLVVIMGGNWVISGSGVVQMSKKALLVVPRTAALLGAGPHYVTGVYMKNWSEYLPGMHCPC